jgi:hypothetical protein
VVELVTGTPISFSSRFIKSVGSPRDMLIGNPPSSTISAPQAASVLAPSIEAS